VQKPYAQQYLGPTANPAQALVAADESRHLDAPFVCMEERL
jgi:hypothetical protein